jgi:hypothetical protein
LAPFDCTRELEPLACDLDAADLAVAALLVDFVREARAVFLVDDFVAVALCFAEFAVLGIASL